MCVKDFVCYRVDVAASASARRRRRRRRVGTSARRRITGWPRRRFETSLRSTVDRGVLCMGIQYTDVCTCGCSFSRA